MILPLSRPIPFPDRRVPAIGPRPVATFPGWGPKI
jgi:hypothetical protein